MRWLDKLERKYGKYSIPNLMKYIIGGMVIVMLFDFVMRSSLNGMLGFSLREILNGQVWRLVTFIFIPGQSISFFVIFYFLILYFFSNILEQYYGSFKFNAYFFLGSIGTILANVVLEALYPDLSIPLSNMNMYLSLLLAVAVVAPDYEIRIYFILPVKLKYIGMVYGALAGFQILFGDMVTRITTLFSLLNFIVFFGPRLLGLSKQTYRRQTYQQKHKPRPTRTVKKADIIQVAFHCCEVCKRTEVDDPALEFRYCSKCGGHHEYCSDHIFTHTHQQE